MRKLKTQFFSQTPVRKDNSSLLLLIKESINVQLINFVLTTLGGEYFTNRFMNHRRFLYLTAKALVLISSARAWVLTATLGMKKMQVMPIL